jgi:hypothetical protein
MIGGMNPRLGCIAPEGRSKRRLIDEQGCNAFASGLHLTLNWVLVLTLCSSWINSNAIALQELYCLGRVLSRSSIEADLLDHVTVKIVKINDMGKSFVESGTRLLSNHDGMTVSTHEAFEEIEAIEAANRGGAYHTLIIDRDHLTWELRMAELLILILEEAYRLGQLTCGTGGLVESSMIDVTCGDVGRNTLPGCILNCFHHGTSTWMTEALVKPEYLMNLVRSDAFTTLACQTGAIRSNIRDNTIKPLRILEVKGHVEELTDIDVEHIALWVNNALMQQNTLQVNAWAARNLERNFKAF